MKRNQTESNGMILRNQSESIGINRKMTGNNRKNVRITSELRAKTTGKTTENDRRISLRFCHFEEWIPRKFPDFPCIFLENSPKFSDFPRFSLIFSEILR